MRLSPEAVIDAVEKHFISKQNGYSLRRELRALSQKKNERLVDYTIWFETLANRLGDLSEEQRIHDYLAGMRPEFIASREPETFERARQLAANKDNQGERRSNHMDIDKVQSTSEEATGQLSLEQTIAELVAAVRDMRSNVPRRQTDGGMSERQ